MLIKKKKVFFLCIFTKTILTFFCFFIISLKKKEFILPHSSSFSAHRRPNPLGVNLPISKPSKRSSILTKGKRENLKNQNSDIFSSLSKNISDLSRQALGLLDLNQNFSPQTSGSGTSSSSGAEHEKKDHDSRKRKRPQEDQRGGDKRHCSEHHQERIPKSRERSILGLFSFGDFFSSKDDVSTSQVSVQSCSESTEVAKNVVYIRVSSAALKSGSAATSPSQVSKEGSSPDRYRKVYREAEQALSKAKKATSESITPRSSISSRSSTTVRSSSSYAASSKGKDKKDPTMGKIKGKLEEYKTDVENLRDKVNNFKDQVLQSGEDAHEILSEIKSIKKEPFFHISGLQKMHKPYQFEFIAKTDRQIYQSTFLELTEEVKDKLGVEITSPKKVSKKQLEKILQDFNRLTIELEGLSIKL